MKRILIVENDRETRNTLSIVLQVADYDVITFPEGQSFQVSDAAEYDMLIYDMANLKKTSSYVLDAINIIARQLPVVVISEFGHESCLNCLIDNECIGFLQKPFKSKELLAIVETLWHKTADSEVVAMEEIA
ncbi:MAG: response regulator transcription factor [Spartobacteria bacterium]|nr:response regulator transcription factor [Spartobacteria bacterium]